MNLYRLFINRRVLQSFALCATWNLARSSHQALMMCAVVLGDSSADYDNIMLLP